MHVHGKTPPSLKALAMASACQNGSDTKATFAESPHELMRCYEIVVQALKNPDTALKESIAENDIHLVRFALSCGARAFEFDSLWRSPLHFAACTGNKAMVVAILMSPKVSGSLYDLLYNQKTLAFKPVMNGYHLFEHSLSFDKRSEKCAF